MAITILVTNNNDMIVTNYENIMQYSTNVHNIKIFVPTNYGTHDMTKFSATVEIVPPNQVYKVVDLTPETLSEKTGFIQYNMDITADMTVFAGDIEMEMTFVHTDSDVAKTFIRHTTTCKLPVVSIAKWNELITDNAFSKLDEKIVHLDGILTQMKTLANAINLNKADGHRINEDGDLVLTSYGNDLEGTEVPVTTPGDPDIDGNDDGILDADVIYQQVTI